MIINCYGNKNSTNILIQMVDNHDLEVIESEVATIESATTDFYLITVKVINWNHDLSPWKADAVFGNKDFTGEASDTLQEILGLCQGTSKHYYIGGYSLAGLFALWAVYQTDIFEGVAAASPSVWFTGFIEYMKDTHINCNKVYMSLGDKESKTRNLMWTAEVTHNHPEGIKGAESVASIIYLARSGYDKDYIQDYVIREFGYDLSRTCDEIRPSYHHVESCQQTVPEAITAFLEGEHFTDVVKTAVSLGGDCDTLTDIG